MSMENHRRNNSSGDKFSFPITPIQDHNFEFGCVTPGSPNSPADHLFLNGRLLPHYFPCQPTNFYNTNSFSRSTSRTSSVCSKDSFISSRSNSTNSSRSSSSSSARTSTSETAAAVSADKKLLSHDDKTNVVKKRPPVVEKDLYQARNKPVLNPHYGSSQRWQFIAPAPALKHQVSRGRKSHQTAATNQELNPKKQSKDLTNGRRTWFGLKILRAFVSACKECHAIKPSSRKCLHKKN